MFFDDLAQIKTYAEKTGFSIFVLTREQLASFAHFKNALEIHPDDKDKISIDQVRETISHCQVKQTRPYFIVVYFAEKMNAQAQNAFLKALEEPLENYHFVLLTTDPSLLLPTVRSRAKIFIARVQNPLSAPVAQDETIKNFAKTLISANSRDLPKIAKAITSAPEYKKSENARPFVLSIVSTAIEILYKSYFKTGNLNFIKKIPKLLTLYDNLKQNGNIKLHLVADLC